MISDYGNEFLPVRKTHHSAGYDIPLPFDVDMKAGEWKTINFGLHLESGDIGCDKYLRLCPRSSTGINHGLRLKNTVGIIDSDFRGNIKATICTDVDVSYKKGESILQLIVNQYYGIKGAIELECERNGGVGSTGL